MTLTNAETLEFEETSPRRLGRGRRIAVVMPGVILAGVACGIVGLAFVQGSWWYSYGTDRALAHEAQARVEAIRDEVDASGAAPEAVMWLDAALESGVHPTDVRAYLLEAQEILEAADDPKLTEIVTDLQTIIQTIRQRSVRDTATPYLVSTPEE